MPHLTVGYGRHASVEQLRSAEAALRRRLPVVGRIDRLHRLAGAHAEDSWRVVAELPLRGA